MGQTDFAHAIPGVGRFRVNVFKQRGTLACVMRTLPFKIPEPETIGNSTRGSGSNGEEERTYLVTGPTGSGKVYDTCLVDSGH